MSGRKITSPEVPHEYDHSHYCPSCRKRYGCDLEGCRDWEDKVCKSCYEEFFKKVDKS